MSDTLYSSYTAHYESGYDLLYGIFWRFTEFPVSVSHNITSIKVRAFRSGSADYDLNVSIKAADVNNKPTGAVLASGTYAHAGTDFTTDTEGLMYEIPVSGAGSALTAGNYCIVLSAPSANNFTHIHLKYDFYSADGYHDGQSADSGSSWTVYDQVHIFEEYGTPLALKIDGMDLATVASVNGVAIAAISTINGVAH